MKEEYLWDKTGSDPEIERLENALQAFRYQADDPPALPAKTFALKKEKPRFSFKLAFALTAFAAFAIIFAGVRFQLPDDKNEIAVTPSEISAPPIFEAKSIELSDEKPSNIGQAVVPGTVRAGRRDASRTAAKTTASVFPASLHKVSGKSCRSVTATRNPDERIASSSKVKNPAIKLTKEESYAYNRLMLALSITSSKLKLVTDKIVGIEERDSVPKIGQ